MTYAKEVLAILAIPALIVLSNFMLGYFFRKLVIKDSKEGNDTSISYLDRNTAVLLDFAEITTYDMIMINQILRFSAGGSKYAELIWYISMIPLSFSVSYFSTFKGKYIYYIGFINVAVFVILKAVSI